MASPYTIESIINRALFSIGYPTPIGGVYDGRNAALVALSHWGETRDALLYELKPTWAHKDAALVLSKSAPNINNGFADYTGITWSDTYPSVPWLYEYTWPADCIRPMQVKSPPGFVPIWRPRSKPFLSIFDPTSSTHAILTNQDGAILNYISSIIDPNDWYADFVELMIQAMAKKLEPEFGKKPPPQQQQGGQQGASNAAG